jgi:hypothetical protein
MAARRAACPHTRPSVRHAQTRSVSGTCGGRSAMVFPDRDRQQSTTAGMYQSRPRPGTNFQLDWEKTALKLTISQGIFGHARKKHHHLSNGEEVFNSRNYNKPSERLLIMRCVGVLSDLPFPMRANDHCGGHGRLFSRVRQARTSVSFSPAGEERRSVCHNGPWCPWQPHRLRSHKWNRGELGS